MNLPIDEPAASEIISERPLFYRLMADPAYRERYHGYLSELVEGIVDSGRLTQTIAQARELIAPYVQNDATAYVTYEEFLEGVSALETFCRLRAESIKGQLAGTIPTTQAGQAAAEESLVDASALDLADLGELADLDG